MTRALVTHALVIALAGGLLVEPAAAPVRGLAVTTDPDGASVFVDEHLAGSTPLRVADIAAGTHRVRIVKNGFLENARVVTVPARGVLPLAVRLTRANASSGAGGEQVISRGSGGSSKKWLWIAVAGGAAAAGLAVAASGKNAAPAAGTISVSPAPTGLGMSDQTTYTFTAQGASDPDGDPLSFSWNFGDGSTGSGASATHVYTRTGTFNVALSVSDGKNAVSAPGATVNVGPNLAGTWSGATEPAFSCPISTLFAQSGTGLAGAMNFVSPCTGSIGLTSSSLGALTHPAPVTWRTVSYNHTISDGTVFVGVVMSFTGTTDSSGTSMTGTLTMTSSVLNRSATVSLRKQ